MNIEIDLTSILCALIVLGLALVLRYVIPLMKDERLRKWARIGVNAAEMIFKGEKMGEQKFEYVCEFLKSKGFNLNMEELKAVIEDAVFELKNALAG